jgi:hypothetical protein
MPNGEIVCSKPKKRKTSTSKSTKRVKRVKRTKRVKKSRKLVVVKRSTRPRLKRINKKGTRVRFGGRTFYGGAIIRKTKGRKSPSYSATQFAIGTMRDGNDGHVWEVIRAGNTRRWKRM